QAGRVDPRDVVRVAHVGGEHRHHDLDLVAVAVLEGGPHGPVDQPGRQDGGLGGAALPAEEPSGDLAGGVHALLDVDREGKEVDALARRRGGGGGEDL